MRILNACFFCTTPFQILSAVNISLMNNEKADIYIGAHFPQAIEYASRLEKIGIFEKVIIIDEEKIHKKYLKNNRGFFNHLEIAKSYLHINEIAKMILVEDTHYEKAYTSSSRIYVGRMVQLYFLKNRINTEFIYFDDGEGSYYNKITYSFRFLDILVRIILLGTRGLKSVVQKKKILLYSPELYKKLNPSSNAEVFTIKPFSAGEGLQTYVNDIFAISEKKLIGESVIIMDTVKTEFIADHLELCYELVVEHFGVDNVVIKKHPRDTSISDRTYKYYCEYSIPFEALSLNLDMENKVVIALSSTATVMPKIIFNQEPYIVMLYELINIKNESKRTKKQRELFYKQCKAMYNDKGKFNIPKSCVEFENVLKRIKNELENK